MRWLAGIEPRAVLWGGLTVALALLAGAALASWLLWLDARDDAQDEVRRVVRLLGQHAARVVEPVDHTLREMEAVLLSAGFGRVPMSGAKVHETIRPFATVGPVLARIVVLDRDGRVAGASDAPQLPALAAGAREPGWPGAQRVRAAGGLAIGEPMPAGDGRAAVVPLARPIVDPITGETLGALVAKLRVDELQAAHRILAFSAGWSLALLRDDGRLLAGQAGVAPVEPPAASIAALAESPELVVWGAGNGAPALLGLLRSGRWPLVAAVALDARTVGANWWRRSLAVLSSAVPAALATAALAWLGAAAVRRSRGLSRTLDLANARYRSLVHSSPDGIMIADQGCIAFANPAMARLAGVDGPQALLGRRVDALLESGEEPAPGVAPAPGLEQRLRPQGGPPFEVETLAVRGNGDGSLQLVVRDISARKRAERRLRDSEQRYRRMVAAAPDFAFLLLDADGVVTDVSPEAAQGVLGRTGDLLGRPLGALFPPAAAAHDLATRLLGLAATGTRPVEREGWCLRSDGSRVWAQLILTALDADDQRPTGFHVVVRDVGARKAMQDQLAASRRRIEALALATEAAREREKVRIARELHDELGQVLTVQQLDVEMLAEAIDPADAGAQERLHAMRERIETALATTRRIAGDLRPLVLDDLGLVAAMEWLLAQARRRGGLEGSLTVAGDPATLPEPIATAVFRIAQESLTNVMRHADARSVAVRLEVGDGAVTLAISDDGRGVDPAAVRRGLGLLGIEERARLLGGHADIVSRPGGGTQVRVQLPASGPQPATLEEEGG